MDYVILIDKIESKEDYQKLMMIQKMSLTAGALILNDQDAEASESLSQIIDDIVITYLEDIKHLLNGVGRLTMYECKDKKDLRTPEKMKAVAFYEG